MQGSFPLLKTRRLLLRQFVATDLDNVFYGLSHPEVIKYYGVSFSSSEETKNQMKWYAELEEKGSGIFWAVCLQDNQAFAGAAGLYYINRLHRKAETGFWLLPEFWGRGLMTEAMEPVCNYGFQQLQLHRIEGFVETENSNSKKVMERLQFQYEGTQRDCEFKNGRFISLDMYARLNNKN